MTRPSPLYRYIGALGARVICDNIPGLVSRQRQLCQRYPDIMRSVGEGAREWIRECQHQFRHHRWNCTTLDRDHTVFGRAMLRSRILFQASDAPSLPMLGVGGVRRVGTTLFISPHKLYTLRSNCEQTWETGTAAL